MKVLKKIIEEIKQCEIKFYVYVLYKPDAVPFYVGKGKTTRYSKSHHERLDWHEYEAKLNEAVNWLKVNTIRKIWREGEQVLYAIDSWHEDESLAYAREMELIASIGRQTEGTGILTNITAGGEKEQAEPTECTKQKISASLKKYYKDPEAIKANSERVTKYFMNNPEACERARQNAIKNNTAEDLARWRKEKPEEWAEVMAGHSDRLKQWYKDNPEAAQKMADNRNKVLKSESHRQNMAEKTRLYIKNNPEEHQKRREKANESIKKTHAKRNELKQKCLKIVRDKLLYLGEIQKSEDLITTAMVERWKKKGWIEKYFPTLPSGGAMVKWQEFLVFLEK